MSHYKSYKLKKQGPHSRENQSLSLLLGWQVLRLFQLSADYFMFHCTGSCFEFQHVATKCLSLKSPFFSFLQQEIHIRSMAMCR